MIISGSILFNEESFFVKFLIKLFYMLPEREENNLKQQMQSLLQEFNRIDHRKEGSIKLSEANRLIKNLRNITIIPDQVYAKIIFNHQKFVSFDQFLALLYEVQISTGINKNLVNFNMVQFLKLLEDYRKKCEQSSLYIEAEKANQKILQVKDKQMKRHKQKLLNNQRQKVMSVNSIQQSRLLDFNQAWNKYMENYQNAAINSIQKLKAKHLRQMQEQQERIKNYLESYMKPSKRILDLKAKQKSLVKQRDYMEAQKVKMAAFRLQQKQKQIKMGQISERIKKRKEVLQKHQEIALLAHLKRIQKDRNEQAKQRQVDSQKMLIKLKNIQNDLVQKQSVQIRQNLQNLRQTMCLTSGKNFLSRVIKERKSLQKINNNETMIDEKVKTKKQKNFKIRVNSFHRTKLDQSLYDP